MVTLSLIVPVFCRQDSLDLLLNTLTSAIDRENLEKSVEVIVIDDCSNIQIVVPKVSFSLFLIRNVTNSGAPYSRQQGFEISQGKFIHFHDSDDSISDIWLSNVIQELTNNSQLDLLTTARLDKEKNSSKYKYQKYFHRYITQPNKIQSRLVYRNCMGPLGGVTFSRRTLEKIDFKSLSSCQDWQMYIEAIQHAKLLVSRPDIKFIFNKMGDDRISHNPRKKILGHLQLAKITGKKSLFGRNIRLFYLYTCKQHIYNKGGSILKFYKKNRLSIFVTFLVVSVYWRIT